MQIIQNGVVEIFTTMDNGVEFVIERLFRGSVMNHNSFITLDKIDVNARCQSSVTLFYILWDKMTEIKESCETLAKNIDDIEHSIVNRDNPIALDYIISRDPKATVLNKQKKKKNGPKQKFPSIDHLPQRDQQSYRDRLTVKLKNAVMFHIVKSRVLKRIPNFSEILNLAIQKNRKKLQADRRKA